MGGSAVSSNKPLMIFTGTDSDYSVEDYLNAVTANLMTNKHNIRNQPHYSKYEEYYHPNQQRFNKNQQINKWNNDQPDPTYQPDVFEPYTRKEQTRRTRQKICKNWIHRRTAVIQTTLGGAAQKWFSVFSIDMKSDWKRFTQEFSKKFDFERNKQQQRVLCNEIRRIPNETTKQFAVKIETLVRKTYSLNTHDYKNTNLTEILTMTRTPQLGKKR